MRLEVEVHGGFAGFRNLAREYITQGKSPTEVSFFDQKLDAGVGDLFSSVASAPAPAHLMPPKISPIQLTVPPAYFKLAQAIACHSSPGKWNLLYRILWRLQFENKKLLEIAIDDDIREAALMEKAVRREIHKVHAFVRFEKSVDPETRLDSYSAWMETEHPVIELAAPFFARRFGDRKWTILTPQGSAFYDGEELTFGDGVLTAPPRGETLDDLWKTYYKSTFNPARIKLKAMRAEMPLKYWKALPETDLISELVREAPERLNRMAQKQNQRAHPPETDDIEVLKAAAKSCDSCPLFESATQTVFGEGPKQAKIMIIGEQPGDEEDQRGRPFVGPAGEVFDLALNKIKLDRKSLYVTNSVKHFKWKPGPPGKPRLHQKPSGGEMHACRPWLEKEIDLVQPEIIVCLGATAATVLFGRAVKLGDEIGKVHENLPWAPKVLVTYHPSAILRALTNESRESMRHSLEETLKLAQQLNQQVVVEERE